MNYTTMKKIWFLFKIQKKVTMFDRTRWTTERNWMLESLALVIIVKFELSVVDVWVGNQRSKAKSTKINVVLLNIYKRMRESALYVEKLMRRSFVVFLWMKVKMRISEMNGDDLPLLVMLLDWMMRARKVIN
jgi:hypothetical protein